VENTGWEGRCMVWFRIQSSEGGSPHLSRLRTDRLAPVNKFDYVLMHTGFMGSRKLSVTPHFKMKTDAHRMHAHDQVVIHTARM
jgi:hypothetical protein